ncbi:MAG: type II toxin-antitoxin system prevent-host-death family antitoxin, partial [Vicinamibacterales bacterium]
AKRTPKRRARKAAKPQTIDEANPMPDLTVSAAREDFGQTVDRVHHRRERVRITKHGRPFVALVPAEDLDLLEALEDKLDLEAVREALAESSDRIPYDRVRRELGLA